MFSVNYKVCTIMWLREILNTCTWIYLLIMYSVTGVYAAPFDFSNYDFYSVHSYCETCALCCQCTIDISFTIIQKNTATVQIHFFHSKGILGKRNTATPHIHCHIIAIIMYLLCGQSPRLQETVTAVSQADSEATNGGVTTSIKRRSIHSKQQTSWKCTAGMLLKVKKKKNHIIK